MSINQVIINNLLDDIKNEIERKMAVSCDPEITINVIPPLIADILAIASKETFLSVCHRLSAYKKMDDDMLNAYQKSTESQAEALSEQIMSVAYDYVNDREYEDELDFLLIAINIILFCANGTEFTEMKSLIVNRINL